MAGHCAHCKRWRMLRNELCYACRSNPDIKKDYRCPLPSTGSGVTLGYAPSKPASYPDRLCMPGTLGRMAVIRERIARGESTTHPEDLPHDRAEEHPSAPLAPVPAPGG